jgi:uncharacterized membrane protein YedE/YeeE
MMFRFYRKKSIALLLTVCFLLTMVAPGFAAGTGGTGNSLQDARDGIVGYYSKNKTNLDTWREVIGLKEAGQDVSRAPWVLPDWKTDQLNEDSQPTDYAGTILGMLAAGQNPKDVGGRNLVDELAALQNDDGSFSTWMNQTIWAGFVVGIVAGIEFLKRGFNLGRAQTGSLAAALIMPLVSVVIILLVIYKPLFNAEVGGPIFTSAKGPGSLFAPLAISLAAGLIVGFLAQRARLCLSGGIRDYALTKDTYLLKGYGAIFVGVLIANLILGYFNLGFVDQPVAHTDGVWNFMGMALVGLAGILAGGCPLRQLIMSGQGDTDGGITVLGMVAGAAIAHNFMLASSPAGPTPYGKIVVIIGLIICAGIGWVCREA